MATTIKLKNSVTTTNAPSSLVQGEVAINITDKKVWVGNAATTPVQLLGDGGSVQFTTVDTTNLQVTNIKAKDGTASASIANSTGALTVAAAFAANGGATLGDASGDALTINSSAVSIPNGLNFDSNTFVIDATNNSVGIGTSSPQTRLHLDYTGSNAAAATGLGAFQINQAGVTTLSGTSGIEFKCSIFGSGYGTKLVAFDDGSLVIGNRANSATWSERMRIDSSGNVGIGTSSPAERLDVQGTGDIKARIYTTGATLGTHAGLYLKTGSYEYIIQNFTTTAGSAGALRFYDITANTERMRISSAGNVGIGTNNPVYPLQVSAGSSGSIAFMVNPSGLTNFAVIPSNSGTTGTQIGTTGGDTFAFITNNTERMRIDSSGNAMIGCTTANNNNSNSMAVNVQNGNVYLNHVNGTANGTGYIQFALNGTVIGTITQDTGTSVKYNTTSDYRLKENVQPMVGALNKIKDLKPVTFTWIGGENGQGFIAHELQAVVPDCVTGEKDAVDEEGNPVYQGVDTSFLVATLTAAIKEQQAMIEELKQEVAKLKGV